MTVVIINNDNTGKVYRPAISNIENDDLISVDSLTSVLVKPEGKNRVDKYSFTKGKHAQRIFIGRESNRDGPMND